jgi:hypothetical protein
MNSPLNAVDALGLIPKIVATDPKDLSAFENALEAFGGVDVHIVGKQLLLESNKPIESRFATADSAALVSALLKSNASFALVHTDNVPFALALEYERQWGIAFDAFGPAHLLNMSSFRKMVGSCPKDVSKVDVAKASFSILGHEIKEAVEEFVDPVGSWKPAHEKALKWDAKYLLDVKGPKFLGDYGPADMMGPKGVLRDLKPGESAGRKFSTFKLQIFPDIRILPIK